jgi:hypothetical protein
MMRLRTKIAALPLAALAICAALQFQHAKAASVVLTPTVDLSATKTTAEGHWNGTSWDPPTFTPGVVTDGPTLEIGHHYICDPCQSPGNPLDSRAVLLFDLSSIPGPIVGASLKLNQIYGDGDPPPLNYGYAVLRKIGTPWNAGSSASDIWSAVGDANSSSLVGAFSITADPVAAPPTGNVNGPQVLSNAAILAAVQGWQSNPATNYGFGLKEGAEGFTITVRRWDSSSVSAGSPMLTVEYVPEPASAALFVLAAGCVAMWRRRLAS